MKFLGRFVLPFFLLLLLLWALLSWGCRSPWWQADRANRRGLKALPSEHYKEAMGEFELAAAFGFREHIPLYNLADIHLYRGEITAAHEGYERALRVNPRLSEAWYNDGQALYLWGQEELDLENCDFARTLELWQLALGRFQRAHELVLFGELKGEAAGAVAFVEERIEEVLEKAQACGNSSSEDPDEGEDGGEGGAEGESGGQGEDDGEGGNGEGSGKGGAKGGGGSGDSEGNGGGGDQGNGEGGGSQPLSAEEREQLGQELERIREEGAGVKGYDHSGRSQISPESAEEGKKGGKPIRW